MSKETKTNAMRMLDRAKISYEVLCYEVDESDLSGLHVSEQTGIPPERLYKTLVLKGEKRGVLVCCIPVDKEIDLKAFAAAAGDKRVEMLHQKDVLAVTGYIRGGCSPIGMKKKYPTYLQKDALDQEKIGVSAGMRGLQLVLKPQDLIAFCEMTPCDVAR